MQAAANRAATAQGAPPELMRAAFRDLHGTRLHGFALLVTLGDRANAARLTAEALASGMARADELRHPERAAAWLRRRVTQAAGRSGDPARRRAGPEDRQALAELGVDAAMFAGLSGLTTRQRAALVADSVERLDRGDVATVVGINGARLDRLIRSVRDRYAVAVASGLDDETSADGPTATRIRTLAARALT
jgi:DNA-directed RNA polymerase specialized sigma24 family protein